MKTLGVTLLLLLTAACVMAVWTPIVWLKVVATIIFGVGVIVGIAREVGEG